MHSKGGFSCSYEEVTRNLRTWKTDESRIKLFKGFFSDELFRQLRAHEDFLPISIWLIDVDLHVSCVPVLEFIKDYWVEGSILLFDDYNHFGKDHESGERRALSEFEARHPTFRKEHLFDYGWEGVAFRVSSVSETGPLLPEPCLAPCRRRSGPSQRSCCSSAAVRCKVTVATLSSK
jgi:hypothetical protein